MSIVPVIDISPYLSNDADAKAKASVATEVDAACRDIGFLVIDGHGVSSNLIDEMYKSAGEYFALPFWGKMRHKMPADCYRGYTPFGAETLALSLDDVTPPDIKESFSIGPFAHAADAYHFGDAGYPYFAPNRWPPELADMQSIWQAYYTEMNRLATDLMRIFALALDLPEHWFDEKIDRHITNFSAIHYPAQTTAPLDEQLRAGAHTDYGSLTIVQTNTEIGGLEVQIREGKWSRVPILPGTFVVNIGDLMAEWTNDRWISTMHRVANPLPDQSAETKTSLLFFHQPNYDAVVECLRTCTGPENPPRYQNTTSGEHVTAKINKHREL